MTRARAKRPEPRLGILDIAAYVPGKSAPRGANSFKLSANESPIGTSPKALAAFLEAANGLSRYPDGSATALRSAIAAHYGLSPEHIVCGAGSDELLQLLAHAYLGQGDEAIYSQYGFLVYPIAIKSNGAISVVAPEKNFIADIDAILELVTDRTRMIFLANPNNPTGTYLPFSEVKRLHAGLPSDVLLVLENLGRIGLTVLVSLFGLFILNKLWQRQRFLRQLRMSRISPEGLWELTQAQQPSVILDVRTPLSRGNGGVIPGALLWSDPDRKMATLDLAPDTAVVVYCACPNDASAALVARRLMAAGFKNVRPLHGGIDAWQAAGFELEYPGST